MTLDLAFQPPATGLAVPPRSPSAVYKDFIAIEPPIEKIHMYNVLLDLFQSGNTKNCTEQHLSNSIDALYYLAQIASSTHSVFPALARAYLEKCLTTGRDGANHKLTNGTLSDIRLMLSLVGRRRGERAPAVMMA
ncbi:MAG: hypothetical protein JNK24_05295 [Alphaproteobacteria bacterium]|nr:hypothetical protein [Alphaproteobacteria bacterium]